MSSGTLYELPPCLPSNDRALSALNAYSKAAPQQRFRVLLLTELFDDGLGDYANLLTVAHAVRRTVAEADLFCIAVIPEGKWDLVEALDSDRKHPFPIERIKYVPSGGWGLARTGPTPLQLSAECVAYIEKTDVCLEVSRSFSRWDSVKESLPEGILRTTIPEYGCKKIFRLDMESPFSQELSIKSVPDLEQDLFPTGLGSRAWYFLNSDLRQLDRSVDERGPSFALDSLSKETQGLLKSHSHKDWGDYLCMNQLFLAYMKQSYCLAHFICSVAWMQRGKRQNIDIVCPSILKPANFSDSQIRFLELAGIQNLICKDAKNHMVRRLRPSKGTAVKNLRLIHAFPMPQKDMHYLMAAGGPVVGVSGNGTLTEALSLGRLPFQEKAPYWENIFSTLQALVQNLPACDSALLRGYYQQIQKLDSRSVNFEWRAIGSLLNEVSLWKAQAQFAQQLWAKHNFDNWAPAIVRRAYWLKQEPSLREAELTALAGDSQALLDQMQKLTTTATEVTVEK